jgi:hypothetical protein
LQYNYRILKSALSENAADFLGSAAFYKKFFLRGRRGTWSQVNQESRVIKNFSLLFRNDFNLIRHGF